MPRGRRPRIRHTDVSDRAILNRGRNGQTLGWLAAVLGMSVSSLCRRERYLLAQNGEGQGLQPLPLNAARYDDHSGSLHAKHHAEGSSHNVGNLVQGFGRRV